MITADAVDTKVDKTLATYHNGEIRCYRYTTGSVDRFKQREKTFDTPVTVVGRAILNPTKEMLTVIGNNEQYEIAFLFSRLEMIRKFPSAAEGEWISTSDQMWWNNRRFKIERVAPTGQVFDRFSELVILGMTIQGHRDS